MRERRPQSKRSVYPDGLIDGAWNPATRENDLIVRVEGAKLEHLQRWSLSGFAEAQNIKSTVVEPDSVWGDLDGDYVFYHRPGSLPVAPRTVDPIIFMARVRKTGGRCSVWGFEPEDPSSPGLPLAKGSDRFRQKIL
ncbi:MAG: hypothetical protein HY720_04800 [Planctomycetes bacterium]|nr:hypothetical protein [Planctomycetota bacterium]